MKKKMIVWSMNIPAVQIEHGKRVTHYYHITQSTWGRIEKLSWDAEENHLRIFGYTHTEGLMALVIERR